MWWERIFSFSGTQSPFDVGEEDGVKVDMPVVTDGGLVGKSLPRVQNTPSDKHFSPGDENERQGSAGSSGRDSHMRWRSGSQAEERGENPDVQVGDLLSPQNTAAFSLPVSLSELLRKHMKLPEICSNPLRSPRAPI
jgi:hypothetical protein